MPLVNLFRMTGPVRARPWIGYTLALLLPIAAFGICQLLGDIARHFPFIIFLPAIIIATLLGGAAAGLVAAALTLVVVDYTLVEPIGQLWPISHTGWWSFAFYGFAIALNIAVIDGMLRAFQRLAETDDELQRANAALELERQRLRAVIDQAPIGVSIASRDGGAELNERARAIMGHGLQGADDTRYAGYGAVHRDGRSYEVEDYPTIRALRRGERVEAEEMLYRIGGRGEDHVTRRLSISSAPILDGDAIVGAVTILADVEEERAARDALQRLTADLEEQVAARTAELQLYRDIVQSHPTPICAFDPALRLTVFNAAHADEFFRISGHRVAPGEYFPALFPADQEPQVRDFMDRALSGEVFTITGEFGHDDFAKPHWESRYAPLRDDGGAIIGAFHHAIDISPRIHAETELRETQDALRQAQKMEAVGQLTGGIAHDFNNLLGAVLGGFDLIRRHPDDPTRVARIAESGMAAAERGAKLTAQLLAFSRAQRIDARPVVVADLIEGMRDLLERTLGPQVRIRVEAEDRGAVILSDPLQLEMAVLNLAINARDAMPEGGDLVIRSRPRAYPGDAQLAAGDYVELSVTDTGQGMPADVAERAFDPFFTTKGVGAGTGLGLSQVYNIAKAANGRATIESRPGAGTTVSLLLPRTDQAPAAAAPAPTGVAGRAAARSVLVIDDDAAMRTMLSDMLDALGFRVRTAEDGATGLDAVATEAPDAIVLDYAMPGMTGAEVARRLRERGDDTPILFASGYSDTQTIERAVGPDVPMLRKPFRTDALRDALAALIG